MERLTASIPNTHRMDRLEERLNRIEQHLGWSSAPQRIPPCVPGVRARPIPAIPVVPLGDAEIQPPPISMPPVAPSVRVLVPVLPAAPELSTAPAPFTAPAPLTAPAPRAKVLRYEPAVAAASEPSGQSAWEQLIGLKLAGWVGAIVLVIGAGLGIKYLYDIGFFGGVSPAVWLSLLSAGAFALIGAGEYVYRSINKISATGLYGAGVAGLFLISFAGHGYYGLYQRETAFVLMALATLVGAGVAMRARLVSIAALSLIGGLLAPLVLEGDSNLVVPFLSYLLMLQVVALVLAWWGGTGRWWGLRGLSLAGACIWTATLIAARQQPWGPAMWFSIAYAALYHFELILSTVSRRRPSEARGDAEAGAGFSVIVTAVLAGALLWIFSGAVPAVRGIWMVALSAATLLLGVLLHRGEATRMLAYGYRMQAILLLLLAVPVAFSGAAVCFGWAGVAVALAAVGGKLSDRPTRHIAIAAWVLAGLNLIAWSTEAATLDAARTTWLTLFGHPLLAWTIVAWALALAGHAIAWFTQRDEEQAGEAVAVSIAASALFATAALGALPPLAATGILLAYAWLLVAADRLAGAKLALLPQAWGVLAVAAAKWAVIDTLSHRLAPDWSPAQYLPVLNPLMLTGVAISGSIIAMYRLHGHTLRRLAVAPVGVLALVAAVMTIGLTLEVDRVVERIGSTAWPRFQMLQMAWTMLWSLALAGFLWLYTKIDPAAQKRQTWCASAWFVTGLLAMKFIVVDTLFWWWTGAGAAPGAIANMQTIAAMVVAGALLVVHRLVRPADEQGDREKSAFAVSFAALLVVTWAGTLEIDRLVASGLLPGLAVWPKWQLRQFAWSACWTLSAIGFLVFASWRDDTAVRRVPLLRMLTAVPVVLAIKYLLLDTLFYRLFRGPAPAAVALNLQSFCGAIVFSALLLVRHLLTHANEKDLPMRTRRRSVGAIAMIMLLWLGSLEIDRAFVHSGLVTRLFAQPRVAEQVALSIFWSAFAIGCVFAGFRLRIAGLRYFGLALFAFTLVKIGIVDLQGAQRGYRILSFMGLGGLLLVTSVLYGKLSPRLLRELRVPANDGSP